MREMGSELMGVVLSVLLGLNKRVRVVNDSCRSFRFWF